MSNDLNTVFENIFAAHQGDLRGTEQEIVVFKATARLWFDIGVRETASLFHAKQIEALAVARAEVDKHFAFLHNIQ